MIATALVIGVRKRGNDEQDGELVDREHNPEAVCEF